MVERNGGSTEVKTPEGGGRESWKLIRNDQSSRSGFIFQPGYRMGRW